MLHTRSKLLLAFAIVYIVWGSTYLAIKYAVATIPPFLMAGVRFTIAGAILYLWARKHGEPRPKPIHWRNAFIIGALLLLLGNGGVVWAEQTVPSGLTALLVATVPLWLVLLDWLRPSGKRPSWGVLIGVLVGLVGMIQLIGLNGIRDTNVPLLGALVLTLASLSWAAGSLFARTAEMPHSLLGTGMEMLCGGACLLLAALFTGDFQSFDPQTVSSQSLISLGYLLVLGSLVAYTAYSWLLRNTSPAAVGTYAYVNPVIAVLLGWLIANESINRQTMIGAGIIVGAVIIITTAQAKTAGSKTVSQSETNQK